MKILNSHTGKAFWALSGAFLLLSSRAFADGPFAQGNLVLSFVDSESTATPPAAPTSAATRLKLVEFLLNGTATGQFYNLPGKVGELTGANQYLAPSGSATSESRVNLSADGRYLIVTGYNAVTGTLTIVNTRSPLDANGNPNAGGVQRVVGRVNWRQTTAAGAINTTTALNDAFDKNNIRSAASVDGTSFYIAGTSDQTVSMSNPTPADPTGATAGLRFALLGGNTSTQVQNQFPNTRTANVSVGRAHVVSSTAALDGSATFNPGLPTTLQTAYKEVETSSTNYVITNSTSGNTFTSFSSAYDIYFADPDTCYVADDRGGRNFVATTSTGTSSSPGTENYRNLGGGLYRFKRNPLTNTWSATPDEHFNLFSPTATVSVNEGPGNTVVSVPSPVGLVGLTGTHNASGNVVLYATTTDNRLVTLTDTGASATFSTLYTVPTASKNLVLRGITILRPVTAATVDIAGLLNAGNGNNGVAPKRELRLSHPRHSDLRGEPHRCAVSRWPHLRRRLTGGNL